MEAPTVGIGRLLKEGGRFFIPHHQRDYSWSEDELDQLFKDVYDAKDSGQSEYFVSLMVFKPESERVYTIIVRYQLVGGGRTGRLEISCARLAHQIFERKCANTTEAAGLLKDILPNDDQFREDFRTKEEKNGRKARYLLSFLERQARAAKRGGVAAPELRPSGTLTLEHVFPKSPGDESRALQEDNPDFADECTHRLGNLCLLSDVNRALGNEGFDRKKAVFAESSLLTTREISKSGDWNRTAVDSRQAAMAKLAVALWRVDF